ncbi:SUMF1/EgtB/PvdO family nonheme iron enzyme [Prosthecobacter sp.]|uniref:SUMF1/EgtB/PvdO family nonheme iron enzyme n=1 Tax=Prosthecobacter sp. TaxID=1965333 RepID=UPI0037834940
MKCLLLTFCILSFTLSSLAAERHALVIGNTHYPEGGVLVTPLDNCITDARLVASTLQGIGFKVVIVEDATRGAMDDALLAWEEKLPKDCEAVVYFAGHGIEHNGKNYLLGTNARLKAQSRIGEEALEAETVAKAMLEAGARSSFLFLDCCREAPPADWVTRGIKKRGLAEVKVDGDIIIAYAAKPGASAMDLPTITGADVKTTNGPYAQALARFLRSGLKHTDVFQQVRMEVSRLTGGQQRTWESGSFIEEYYFSTPSRSTPSSSSASVMPVTPVPVTPVPVTPPPAAAEVSFAGTTPGQSWKNSHGTPFRWCPPGEFWMGSTPEDKATFNRDACVTSDEPRHKVKLSLGFWLSQHEATQIDWETVMGATVKDQAKKALRDDTLYALGGGRTTLREFWRVKKDARPEDLSFTPSSGACIYMVSWEEAMEYCRKLTDAEHASGKIPANWRYTLPTEAQWEHACRAGTETPVYSGRMIIFGSNNSATLDAISWYGGNSSQGFIGPGFNTAGWPQKQYPGGLAGPRQVGLKQPNAWGLHDMIGNVWEWCTDWYFPDISSGVENPIGPAYGTGRVVRGGSWDSGAAYCRAAKRRSLEPGLRLNFLGFRPALVRSR